MLFGAAQEGAAPARRAGGETSAEEDTPSRGHKRVANRVMMWSGASEDTRVRKEWSTGNGNGKEKKQVQKSDVQGIRS